MVSFTADELKAPRALLSHLMGYRQPHIPAKRTSLELTFRDLFGLAPLWRPTFPVMSEASPTEIPHERSLATKRYRVDMKSPAGAQSIDDGLAASIEGSFFVSTGLANKAPARASSWLEGVSEVQPLRASAPAAGEPLQPNARGGDIHALLKDRVLDT